MTKDQEEMLNDTINHFNSNNRSYSLDGCTYSPAHNNTQGCAIGRLIKDKALCAELDVMGDSSNSYVGHEEVFKKLPLEIQSLGKGFLEAVQTLHDSPDNWNENGLSEMGEEEVGLIKNNFK
jgi:hypothetical protein